MHTTDSYEVEEERVEWGTIPEDWRTDFTDADRVAFPYANRRWSVRRVYTDKRGRTWGEPVGLFGRKREAVAECDKRNAALKAGKELPY